MVGTNTVVLLADTILIWNLIIIVWGHVSNVSICIYFDRLTDAEAKLSWCDGAVTKEEKGTEHWLGEKIQDTVKDGLAVRCDHVATFCKAPGDGVEEPQENCEDTAGHVGTTDIGTESVGVATAKEDQNVHDVQERKHAEGKESPLRLSQRPAGIL